MHVSSLALLTLSTSLLTSALNITYPTAGTIIQNNKDFNISWTAITSDPALLNIDLTNGDGSTIYLGANISTSELTLAVNTPTIESQKWVGNEWTIVINSAGDLGNVFVAKTGEFAITGSSNNSSATATGTGTSSSTSTTLSATAAATSSGASARVLIRHGIMAAVAAGICALV